MRLSSVSDDIFSCYFLCCFFNHPQFLISLWLNFSRNVNDLQMFVFEIKGEEETKKRGGGGGGGCFRCGVLDND